MYKLWKSAQEFRDWAALKKWDTSNPISFVTAQQQPPDRFQLCAYQKLQFSVFFCEAQLSKLEKFDRERTRINLSFPTFFV